MAGVRIEDIEVDKNAANKLAQKLTSNDGCLRRRTMKKLRRLIEHSAGGNDGLLNEINLLRLWKGLHYCMWIADDPQFQEELAENLASLVSCFMVTEHSLLFVDAFLKVETQEWPLLDFHRLDKFMMLARKMLKSTFQHLQSHMSEHLSKQFVNILEKSVFVGETNTANGFVTHIKSILTEELKNLMDGQVFELHFKELVEMLQTKHQNSVAENMSQKKGSGDSLENISVQTSSDSPLKKGKRKLDCGNNEVMGTAKKAKISNAMAEGPSQEKAVESASEEVEINIWVPNKKYNGALKEVATKHFQMMDKHCRTVSPKRIKAADLFVTPKSDPTHCAKKRVSFALNQNKAQNYEDSLIMTPKLTFDPSRKPVKGVLKFSPGVPERLQKSKLFKKKKNIKRFKGKKFF